MRQGESPTAPARDCPGPQPRTRSSFSTCGDACGPGASPPDSLQEHQLQPGPNKALLCCLHVLGGPDLPQNPLPPVTRCFVLQLSLPCVLGNRWRPLPGNQDLKAHPPSRWDPALPSDVLPLAAALCTRSSPSPCHPPQDPWVLLLCSQRPGVQQPGGNAARLCSQPSPAQA